MACVRDVKPLVLLLLALLALGGCPPREQPQPPPPVAEAPPPEPPTPASEPAPAGEWALTSPAFQDGETIPARHTGDGEDLSPALEWTAPPEGTQELALICDDPDAPAGTWNHWVAYGIPPDVTRLPEGVEKSETVTAPPLMQGKNSFGEIGYDGPAPPPGSPHRYQFALYALGKKLDLAAGADKEQLLAAMEGNVLGQVTLEGMYAR